MLLLYLGIQKALDTRNNLKAQLIVYGTPAEEGGGGKILMIEHGSFDNVDICMMAHPTPYEIPTPIWLAAMQFAVIYHGQTSHAAACPWEGVNALDAVVSCYNAISMLRQQIKQTARIGCVIKDGGVQANIIPELASLEIIVRDV